MESIIPEWLKNKTIAVFDLETDLIPTTKIFCNSIAIVKDGRVIQPSKLYTNVWTEYSDGSLMESTKILNECDYVCAHNLMGFDMGEVEKHLGIAISAKPLDTLLLSKIIFSSDDLYAMDPGLKVEKALWGSYSLKAFGQRFGDHKIDYSDFSHLNEEMGIYCKQDTDLAARLLIFLLEKANFPLEAVVEIEHEAARIIYEQSQFGFYIDIDLTRALNTKLLTEKGQLARELLDIFSPKFLKGGPVLTYKNVTKSRKFIPNPNWVPPW